MPKRYREKRYSCGHMSIVLRALTFEHNQKKKLEMGIKNDSFDDLVAPVIQSPSIVQDEFHECPDCEAPLMGEDLLKWETEGTCEYCGADNIETGKSNSETGSPLLCQWQQNHVRSNHQYLSTSRQGNDFTAW